MNSEGSPTPILFVAWTLTYEILFYTILTAAVALRNRYPVFLTASLFIVLLYILAGIAPDSLFIVKKLGREEILNFIAGMSLALLSQQHRVNRITGALLLCLGSFVWLNTSLHHGHRLVDGTIPASMLLIGFLAFELNIRNSVIGPVIKFIGNSTYSIYLIQVFSIPLAYHFLGVTNILRHLPVLGILLLVTFITLICGILTYRLVETKINRFRYAPLRFLRSR